MNRLFIYFIQHLVSTILLVLLVLLSFDVAFAFFGEVADIGRGHNTFGHLLQRISLSLPRRLYELLPMAALIGVMLGAGNLATQGELLAARTAGLSLSRFMSWLVVAGLLVFIPAAWLGEYIAPMAGQQANRMRTQALFSQVTVQQDQGIWIRDGSRYVHIGSVAGNGSLQDIEVYEFTDNQRLRNASKIRAGKYAASGWQLEDVKQTRFNTDSIDVIKMAHQRINRLIDPDMVQVLAREPEHMQLDDLYRYVNYLEANAVNAARYRLDFWSRVMRPLTLVAMVLLGAVIVITARQRQGSGWRLFAGVLIGLAFKLLNDLFAQAGLVYGLAPLLSAITPTLLVAGLIVWIVHRQLQ